MSIRLHYLLPRSLRQAHVIVCQSNFTCQWMSFHCLQMSFNGLPLSSLSVDVIPLPLGAAPSNKGKSWDTSLNITGQWTKTAKEWTDTQQWRLSLDIMKHYKQADNGETDIRQWMLSDVGQTDIRQWSTAASNTSGKPWKDDRRWTDTHQTIHNVRCWTDRHQTMGNIFKHFRHAMKGCQMLERQMSDIVPTDIRQWRSILTQYPQTLQTSTQLKDVGQTDIRWWKSASGHNIFKPDQQTAEGQQKDGKQTRAGDHKIT